MTEQAALEETIRTHPGDREAWLAYAAWLTQQGDPRGELVLLEQRLLERPPEPERGELYNRIGEIERAHKASWSEGWTDEPETVLYWQQAPGERYEGTGE